MKKSLDAGINFFDTANVYSLGTSEEFVGRALRDFALRDEVVVATKVHGTMRKGRNAAGLSRKAIMTEVDHSLRRLGMDYIDLYQLHRPDPNVPIEESLSALNDLVHQGKIRAFGASTFPAEHLMEAAWVASDHRFIPFSTEQPPYSIFVRWIERDLLPTCQKLNMGTMVWSPLNGGWLSGVYRANATQRNEGRAQRAPARFDVSDPANLRKMNLVEELVLIADEVGVTLAQLSLAWVLHHPGVTSAIIGPRIMEHLTTVLGADEVVLSSEVLDRIDALVAPGTTVAPDEARWETPALRAENRR
jgi:aryl-alcohol dehydrogenase-like predicted oxidoreductase